MADSAIPQRRFGRDPDLVSIIGLGGYHLGTTRTQKEAIAVVRTAIDAGVTFMDNAWDYNDGVSEERMGQALKGYRDRVFLMTKVCTHGRDSRTALRQLDQSLKRLQTEYLDVGLPRPRRAMDGRRPVRVVQDNRRTRRRRRTKAARISDE
jgi:aryl-alcohol dehydrogenase-like predicted oxidoreductase